jgi:NADH-quinone oxidoreductase subunit L
LIAAVITGILNKSLNEKMAQILCILGVSMAFLCSVCLLLIFSIDNPPTTEILLYNWGSAGGISFNMGILMDRLTIVMTTVVTFVSMLVHIYSVGYMHDDAGYQRFFSYISLFTFGMLTLVMSNNFLQLFFGWEMVGLMSYLLIGFWFKKETAIFANLKAFLVNRVGDFGFILGIAAIAYYFNALDYNTVFQSVEMIAYSQDALQIFGAPVSAITLICILLFIGAMGKSAQIPLHVWLPDSMEGPTPISALIHAATMVTAGVFMLARLSPLFEYSETALNFIVMIGSLTALLMGLVAIVQNDIKRIIAYSTLSQLGYMMVAMGVSAYSVGIFHLMTHAFFKALLFLGAGSVILALHHEQNIWKMGNLKKYMPITYVTMLIGCLALIGFPFFSGYYSKDLIIHAAEHSELASAPFAYWVVTAGVLITAIYTFRLFFVVFHSKKRFPPALTTHLHEQSGNIYWPLIILAIPSIIAGAVFLNAIQDNYFASAIFVLPDHDVLKEFWSTYRGNNSKELSPFYLEPILFGLKGLTELPFYLGLVGIIITALVYQFYPNSPSIIKTKMGLLYRTLYAKLGFDYLYEKILMRFVLKLANIFWIFGDRTLIDGLGVNGSVEVVGRMGGLIRRFQSGYLYQYAFVMITGFLIMLLWVLWV